MQTINKVPTNPLGYGYASSLNTLPIHTVSPAPKNISQSVSKNNLHTSASVNDIMSRNASVGKINMSIPPPSLTRVSSSAKFNIPAPLVSLKNSYIQNQVNLVPNPITVNTSSTPNILSNNITKNPEPTNIIQQTKPSIQFSQLSKQSLRSSFINNEPQLPQPQVQQSLSISKNKSVVNFNPPLKTSYI